MKRELLFKYFEGSASLDEESEIQAWIDSSEANFLFFMDERNAYDILLMADSKFSVENSKVFKISPLMRNIAASISLFLLGSVAFYLINSLSTKAGMNVVIVPKGQYVELLLSDSTKVFLNTNSKFSYPSTFSSDSRVVNLEGEGYFEVKKELNRPFFVKSEMGDVQVTGTIFNMKSKIDKSVFEVSLFEGGVNIYKDDVMISKLIPNQKITAIGNEYKVGQIIKPESYLWREGMLAFKNESIQKVFERFEEAFDVDIKINPRYNFKNSFTGKFRQSDGLDYCLRLLQKSVPFKYDYNLETKTINIEY